MANEDQSKKIKELEAQVSEQAKIIEELNKALSEKEAENEKLSPNPIFKVGGKSYELVDEKSTARFDGKIVTIDKDSLKEDKKLLEFCVKKGFYCLQERGNK
jgi:cell division septum initiation protein DivIVA